MNKKLAALLGPIAAVTLLITLSVQTGQSEDNSKIERGAYLVEFGGCYDCHCPKKMVDGIPVPDKTRELMGHPADEVVTLPAEGLLSPQGWVAACNGHFTAWAGPWGVSFASNLTPDKKTGLGNWKFEQFRDAMRQGKHRGFGRPILPPMPWPNVAKLSDDDMEAVFMFLQSLPPIENKVPEWVRPPGMPEGN